jgi:ubiquinol-cytochrome c reductase cytochrome b subunit
MAGQEEGHAESRPGTLDRLVAWFDTRLGLSHDLFRPAPRYAINPFYWLGALAVVAFIIQGVTGMMMMLYYVPTTSEAYLSTQFIFQNVSYGRFLETVHLYTAYAMVMLTFMHLMRGYFVSVHKKPRELMWIVGMVMGFITLGFGFTGYLLPWTVVSKSATDVGIGMIDALPQPVSSFLSFLIVGAGGAGAELLRFYDLHVFVLPAALLGLLVVKMYLLETHGISEPVTGPTPLPERKRKLIPIFPDVSLYLFELAALFGSVMLLISAVFPLDLPPQYTPQLAAQFVAQPDWYFLWIYQILKVSVFEKAGLPVALSMVSLIFISIFLLPFIDRGKARRLDGRRKFVTLGAIFVAEILVLSAWGLLTPGRMIGDEQAALVLGGTALLVAAASLAVYKLLFRRITKVQSGAPIADVRPPSLHSAQAWTAGSFVLLLGLGAVTMGSSVDAAVKLIAQGSSASLLASLVLSSIGLSLAVAGTIYLLYRLDLYTGGIRRRVRALEVGWKE